MGNIYSFKWPLCREMDKEIVKGCVSAGLHMPLGEINRISPERAERKKERGKKNHPQGLCWGWILKDKSTLLKVGIHSGAVILLPKWTQRLHTWLPRWILRLSVLPLAVSNSFYHLLFSLWIMLRNQLPSPEQTQIFSSMFTHAQGMIYFSKRRESQVLLTPANDEYFYYWACDYY